MASKSERYSIVRILGNNKPSTKVIDKWTFSTRQKAYDFVAEVEAGTKLQLTDAVKAEEAEDSGETYQAEKLDAGTVYIAHAGSDKTDDRERISILARVGGQESKSGTELVAIAGRLDKLFDLHHFATKMVKAEDQGKLVIATFALNPLAKRQRRQLQDVRDATAEEIANYLVDEMYNQNLDNGDIRLAMDLSNEPEDESEV